MQWKKSYYIATNVSSRKIATTFGDLPDCLEFKSFVCTLHEPCLQTVSNSAIPATDYEVECDYYPIFFGYQLF